MLKYRLKYPCCLVFLLLSCTSSSPTSARFTRTRCFDLTVVVTALDSHGDRVPPGIPIQVDIRSSSGAVLVKNFTDAVGQSIVHLCWSDHDEPSQVEALLPIGDGMFAGSFVSFANTSNTYCIVLPKHIGGHCGEWGTGPKR